MGALGAFTEGLQGPGLLGDELFTALAAKRKAEQQSNDAIEMISSLPGAHDGTDPVFSAILNSLINIHNRNYRRPPISTGERKEISGTNNQSEAQLKAPDKKVPTTGLDFVREQAALSNPVPPVFPANPGFPPDPVPVTPIGLTPNPTPTPSVQPPAGLGAPSVASPTASIAPTTKKGSDFTKKIQDYTRSIESAKSLQRVSAILAITNNPMAVPLMAISKSMVEDNPIEASSHFMKMLEGMETTGYDTTEMRKIGVLNNIIPPTSDAMKPRTESITESGKTASGNDITKNYTQERGLSTPGSEDIYPKDSGTIKMEGSLNGVDFSVSLPNTPMAAEQFQKENPGFKPKEKSINANDVKIVTGTNGERRIAKRILGTTGEQLGDNIDIGPISSPQQRDDKERDFVLRQRNALVHIKYPKGATGYKDKTNLEYAFNTYTHHQSELSYSETAIRSWSDRPENKGKPLPSDLSSKRRSARQNAQRAFQLYMKQKVAIGAKPNDDDLERAAELAVGPRTNDPVQNDSFLMAREALDNFYKNVGTSVNKNAGTSKNKRRKKSSVNHRQSK